MPLVTDAVTARRQCKSQTIGTRMRGDFQGTKPETCHNIRGQLVDDLPDWSFIKHSARQQRDSSRSPQGVATLGRPHLSTILTVIRSDLLNVSKYRAQTVNCHCV